MKPIIPHLWFTAEAKEASHFYTTLFPQSKILSTQVLKDTPSGDCDLVSFSLVGQEFMAISGGPYFKITPSISFFIFCENEDEIKNYWSALSDGGTVMMGLDTYPWAQKYGWIADKFGVSWQVMWRSGETVSQKIVPCFMFTEHYAGKAEEALLYYTSLFPNSHIHLIEKYQEGEPDTPGRIKHAQFELNGMRFAAMDSSYPHGFEFNEAISMIITCDTQEEIDHYTTALSHHPESEQCGWVKDQFGISWQIVPSCMQTMMREGTPEQIERITQAFLPMKKFDITTLQKAYTASV